MAHAVVLQRSSNGWQFVSEAALEQFVWNHLQELFGLTPLQRQVVCNGEICDILAIAPDRTLSILELKNTEDRYLIQQLTRYYANLAGEKLFSPEVDYDRPIRLIAVAPPYHRHNLIDAQLSKLNFELIQFSVMQEQENFYLLLQTLDQTVMQKYPIPYEAVEAPSNDHVPDPPSRLIEWLGSCTRAEQEGFLQVRSKLLRCSDWMKEVVERSSIQYGSSKTKLCAEICFHAKSQKPILFLWLPTPTTYRTFRWSQSTLEQATTVRKPAIGRLRIWTDGQTISHVGHVPEGFGKMKLESEWKELPVEKRPKSLRWNGTSRSHIPTGVKGYMGHHNIEVPIDYWEVLPTMAIEYWLERVSSSKSRPL